MALAVDGTKKKRPRWPLNPHAVSSHSMHEAFHAGVGASAIVEVLLVAVARLEIAVGLAAGILRLVRPHEDRPRRIDPLLVMRNGDRFIHQSGHHLLQ